MRVLNIHQRSYNATPEVVGALIDTLSSETDGLWPTRLWPRMLFDQPLTVGAQGGHGPIRYFVESYQPSQSIRFRFTGPNGFDGCHGFQLVDTPGQPALLTHRLEMKSRGWAVLSWALIYRPMHNALIEDALSQAQLTLGEVPDVKPWLPWVRLLRWLLSGGKARAQRFNYR